MKGSPLPGRPRRGGQSRREPTRLTKQSEVTPPPWSGIINSDPGKALSHRFLGYFPPSSCPSGLSAFLTAHGQPHSALHLTPSPAFSGLSAESPRPRNHCRLLDPLPLFPVPPCYPHSPLRTRVFRLMYMQQPLYPRLQACALQNHLLQPFPNTCLPLWVPT